MNAGAEVSIGSAAARGTLLIGNNGTATFAPSGDFTAYLTSLTVGQKPASGVLQATLGTLDLTNAAIAALDVSGTATIGTVGDGKGVVQLGAGEAYFDNLALGIGTTAPDNLLQIRGTTLTIGDSDTDTFDIGAGTGSLVLDFSDPATALKVYGDWESSGPATNIAAYLADGRLVALNDGGVMQVRYDAPYSIVGLPPVMNDGISELTTTSVTLHGRLLPTIAEPADVTIYWGRTNGGDDPAAWEHAVTNGLAVDVGPFSNSVANCGRQPVLLALPRDQRRWAAFWAPAADTFMSGAVTIEATDAGASEVGPDTGTFTVSRPAAATNGPLRVNYTIGGTAENGVDYEALSGSVDLPAGASNATITVTPLRDRLRDEPDETVTLTLAPGDYQVGVPNSDTVTIANDAEGGLVRVDLDALGPTEDGKTWATAYRTLTAALAQVPAADEFWVAEGAYTPGGAATDTFNLGPDVVLYGGFAGTETSLSQRDWTANETVLSGDLGGGVFARHVLTKSTAGPAVLDGFTVREGAAGAADGGGIYQTAGTLTVANCRLVNNSANNGGAVFVVAGASNSFLKCEFSGNTAAGNGGAVWSAGAFAFAGVDFGGNSAGGSGGALYDGADSGLNTLRNCAFVANSSSAAGAPGGGGALYFSGGGAREIRSATFFKNQANWVGGAIRMQAGQLTLGNCIFWQNSSTYDQLGEDEMYLAGGFLAATYCNLVTAQVAGPGTTSFGAGIMNADPLFGSVTAPYDVHLMSKFGRWINGGRAFDAVTSPCIDAGDPAGDYSLEPQGNGGRINLGRYGNTTEASRTTGTPTGGMLIVR